MTTSSDLLYGGPGTFHVVRCAGCGLMRTTPRPSSEDLGDYYPDNYGPYEGTKVQAGSRSRLHSFVRALKQRLIDFRTHSIPPIEPGRMLEVGCASGAFLHQMAAMGWSVEGIEYSETAARNATDLGCKVHVGALDSVPLHQDADRFDLVTAWMVLEHLPNPVSALEQLNKRTFPGGWLAFSVPNAGSLDFKLFGSRWYALQLPTHLFHFTPGTIAKVLERSGWELVEIRHQRVLANWWKSLAIILREKGLHRLANLLMLWSTRGGFAPMVFYPLAVIAAWFGQTGRMTVWAKKP